MKAEKQSMSKIRHVLLLISLLLLSLSLAQDLDISNAILPALNASMGNSGLANWKCLDSSVLNPAILGSKKAIGLSWFTSSWESDLQNTAASLYIDFLDITWMASFYRQAMDSIPNTEWIDSRIRTDGSSFSAAINAGKFGLGKQFQDWLMFREIDTGYTLGFQNYSFASDWQIFHKIGLLASVYGIDNTFFGLTYDSGQDNQGLNFGVNYRSGNYLLEADYINGNPKGGLAYNLSDMFQVRAGADNIYYTFGLGINYDKISSFFQENWAVRFDFAYMLPIDDTFYSPYTFLSMSLEQSERTAPPIIYAYPQFTKEDTALISGWAPPNTTLWVYINDVIIDKTLTNENGQWEFVVPLKYSQNIVKLQAVDNTGSKESDFSRPAIIVRDSVRPRFWIEARVSEKDLGLNLSTSKPLNGDPTVEIGTYPPFSIPILRGEYKITTDEWAEDNSISIKGTDYSGNTANATLQHPFIHFISPKSLTSITTAESFPISGMAWKLSSIQIKNLASESNIIGKLQKSGQFQTSVPLFFGKNTIEVVNSLSSGKVIYPFYVIRMFKYKDYDDDNASKLATLKVFAQNPQFNPNTIVTQKDFLTAIYRIKQLYADSGSDSQSPTLKEVYEYALSHQWISHKDERKLLTRAEAIELFASLFGLDVYSQPRDNSYFLNISVDHPLIKHINYFLEHGYISNKAKYYALDQFLSREELLQWLTHTPQISVIYQQYFNN